MCNYSKSIISLISILSIITITISYHLHSIANKYSIHSRRITLFKDNEYSSLFKDNKQDQAITSKLYLNVNDLTSEKLHNKKLKHFISIFLINMHLFISTNMNMNIQPSYASTTTTSIVDENTIDTITKYPIFKEVWDLANEHFYDNTFNNHDWKQIKIDYLNKLNNGADEEKLVDNMLALLGDKYTRLLDQKFFESLWKYDAIGIGLLFQSEPNKLMYVSAPPITGSSGAKAGIQKGDIIYAINGISTEQMTAIDLLDRMSNDESNTITIEYSNNIEANANKELRKTIQLTRSKQKAINPITYFMKKLPDNKVAGYIKLTEFNSEAVPALKKALVDLNANHIDELALDLRGNTGGGFQFALNIGGMFMSDKEMVIAAGKGNDKSLFKTSYPEGVLYDKPLVIITDGLSASASEVLVTGLRDNCRAAITGTKTFGKGKIQAVFGLSNGEGITMTVAQYVSPSGVPIQSKGIEPDIPMNTVNPYLNALTAKPDIERVNFKAAEEILSKSCHTNIT